MLKGYHKHSSHLDSHRPITLPILHKLLDSACKLAICRYQVCRFKAMCSTTLYAFLRVGEMTSTSSVGSPPPIQTGQLFKLVAILLQLSLFSPTIDTATIGANFL